MCPRHFVGVWGGHCMKQQVRALTGQLAHAPQHCRDGIVAEVHGQAFAQPNSALLKKPCVQQQLRP